MKKTSALIILTVFCASSLPVQAGPALSQLRSLSAAKASDISVELPAAPAAAQVRSTLVLLDTRTGQTFVVTPAGGGFVHNATGKFQSAVYNGSGYILPTGQYLPVVGGVRVNSGVKMAPGGKAVRWAALVEKTLALGLIREDDETIPGSRYFADIEGPREGPHTADYFSVWGYTDPDGVFYPDFVTIVSENWEMTADGNWRIDQWLHWLGLDGAAQRASHTVIVEDRDGRILEMRSENPEVGDPAAVMSRYGLIGKWDLYKPANR